MSPPPSNPPTRPKYSNQPFSAWKAYLGDDEEPDQSFIEWKKEVLGESSSAIKTGATDQKRMDKDVNVGQGDENKTKEENKKGVKIEEKSGIGAKIKEKGGMVFGARENNRTA